MNRFVAIALDPHVTDLSVPTVTPPNSYDQYSNMVLEDTHERHCVGNKVGDIPLGLYIIRGDSLAFLGEINESRLEESGLEVTSAECILEAQQALGESDVYSCNVICEVTESI